MTYAPEFEWVLAAQWGHYKWHEFAELDGEAQSKIVAAYRCVQQSEAIIAHEQAKKLNG